MWILLLSFALKALLRLQSQRKKPDWFYLSWSKIRERHQAIPPKNGISWWEMLEGRLWRNSGSPHIFYEKKEPGTDIRISYWRYMSHRWLSPVEYRRRGFLNKKLRFKSFIKITNKFLYPHKEYLSSLEKDFYKSFIWIYFYTFRNMNDIFYY